MNVGGFVCRSCCSYVRNRPESRTARTDSPASPRRTTHTTASQLWNASKCLNAPCAGRALPTQNAADVRWSRKFEMQRNLKKNSWAGVQHPPVRERSAGARDRAAISELHGNHVGAPILPKRSIDSILLSHTRSSYTLPPPQIRACRAGSPLIGRRSERSRGRRRGAHAHTHTSMCMN